MVLLFNYLGLWKLKKFHTIKSTARHTYVVYIYIYILYQYQYICIEISDYFSDTEYCFHNRFKF